MNGKSRAGCVVACLRKIRGWSLTAILDEFSAFAGATKINLLDYQFIECFDFDANEGALEAE
jgi:protein tyrosine/serine phosphatase